MYKKHIIAVALASLFSVSATAQSDSNSSSPLQVAFMADIHFHDVYGSFDDGSFKGVPVPGTDDIATIRTMGAQLGSTRLFNENYFALIAALDSAVERGIKYIALPGDFSDDGQPVHLRGLVRILDEYREKHGIEFFAAPGNHDPERPVDRPRGKSDYLGTGYGEQGIFSLQHDLCQNDADVICTDEVLHLGTEGVMSHLKEQGFYPQENNLYYETPFTSDELKTNYSFEQALNETAFNNRQYEICAEGTGGAYKQDNYTNCVDVGDTSYLVEPVEGFWLLSIDSNVNVPLKGDVDLTHPESFEGSSNAGWNKVITHKEHIVEWIADVVSRAEQNNKTLVAFSHYPMDDYYVGASDDIQQFFLPGTQNVRRVPTDNTTQTLVDTGLKVHVNGHLHYNTTTLAKNGDSGLVNIQSPSLAAYTPAYKVLTMNADQTIDVETVLLDEVANYDALFPIYKKELAAGASWNPEILDAKNYGEMNNFHIRALARNRFFEEDMQPESKDIIANMTITDMMTLALLEEDVSFCEAGRLLGWEQSYACEIEAPVSVSWKAWNVASNKAKSLVEERGYDIADLSFEGHDLSTDYLRIQNAGELAQFDIPVERVNAYKLLSKLIDQIDVTNDTDDARFVLKNRIGSLFNVMSMFEERENCYNFTIENNSVTCK
ncbi:metallophosphoesterase [Photobacterium minamisatsumaniensis]|uniref:metallophosphoesterase n=1 Tax=Photobacterium minamisatsumaniensis TaxID=2910233 RepID=UPI003D1370EF